MDLPLAEEVDGPPFTPYTGEQVFDRAATGQEVRVT